jgi:hypothetical protein
MMTQKGKGFSPCYGATRPQCFSRGHPAALSHIFCDNEDEHGSPAAPDGTECWALDRRVGPGELRKPSQIHCRESGQGGVGALSRVVAVLLPIVGEGESGKQIDIERDRDSCRAAGAKARVSVNRFSARLKSCPVTKHRTMRRVDQLSARLKSCPVTKHRTMRTGGSAFRHD